METSDSEYFESADEDFESGDENTVLEKNPPKSVKKEDDLITDTKQLKISKIQEEKCDSVDKNRNTVVPDVTVAKDSENNVEIADTENPIKNKSTKDERKPSEEETENSKDSSDLWDDTELDWGKESAIETEAENIEGSLWDDSEIDWGKESKCEAIENPQKLPIQAEDSSWSSWGSWGVSSILNTATQGVSSLTHGFSTVLESGIGVPEPEELARLNKTEEKLNPENPDKNIFGLGNFVMGVSQFTKLVETTGTKVISGGLDTLETIGKKTMEVLQEGDPGLKKKRAFLKIDQDKPVLSQLLREAKEKAELENKALEEKHFAKKAKNYETLFDDHQGLVHLEALEMLSRQCDIKLQTLLESNSGDALTEMQETMEQVKELCELPDEEEDEHPTFDAIEGKLENCVSELNVKITYKKLIETWRETQTWLDNLKLDFCDERELHQQAIETLAQLTAIAVEQFHRAGELLLVKDHRSTADEADSLVQLTTSLTSLIGMAAAKFSDKLNVKITNSQKGQVNSLITNIFFEASNSSSYIQDAFQLLVPVLQVGAV